MLELPDPAGAARLRQFFDDTGYNAAALEHRLGSARPPVRENARSLSHATREPTLANAIVRLFLLGGRIEQKAAETLLPSAIMQLLLDLGMLTSDGRNVTATIVLVTVEDKLFASDAFRVLDSDQAADFVLPAATHSADFLRHMTVRRPANSVLDLGCGCGVQALSVAAYADTVVATDISTSASQYTQFNALLNNIGNVECVIGDLFEPVAGRRFDRIISNPPFVIGPDSEFTCRDNQLPLDHFCRKLVSDAAGHLSDGGMLQMLCEWVEVEGESWQDRLREWFDGNGCDVWVLHSRPLRPAAYVARRRLDFDSGVESSLPFDDWLAYLESERVTAIHAGAIAMRRRAARNWFRIERLGGDITAPAGEGVLRALDACDFLESCAGDEQLLETCLRFAPDTRLEQSFGRAENAWVPGRSAMLRAGNGLPMDVDVELAVMAFLNLLDGRRRLRRCVADFAKVTAAPEEALRQQLLPVVRLLIGRGLLVPANR